MDLVRLRPSLLAARGPRCGLAAASPARSVAAAHPPGLPSLHLHAITFYHLYVLSIEMVKGQFLCPAKGPKVLPSINVRNSLVGNPPTTEYHIDQQLVLLMLRDNRYNLQLKHMIIKYMEANIIFSGFRPGLVPNFFFKLPTFSSHRSNFNQTFNFSALSIVSVSLLAVENLSDVSPLFLTGLLEKVVAALFMNIYIVGLNQLFDIEIDKSFGLGWAVGSQPLFRLFFISFILVTAYSINLSFLIWKRSAVVAGLQHFARPAVFTMPLIFATAFMSFFSVVIALFKR
uniref:Uncharacterized protein n=1 Tax=Oryza barthii TaxID=65489 RepID=A0A0D3GJH0_9ORYZ